MWSPGSQPSCVLVAPERAKTSQTQVSMCFRTIPASPELWCQPCLFHGRSWWKQLSQQHDGLRLSSPLASGVKFLFESPWPEAVFPVQWGLGAQPAFCNAILNVCRSFYVSVSLRCQTFSRLCSLVTAKPPRWQWNVSLCMLMIFLICGTCFLVAKHTSETRTALLADYWSESDQDDIDGSLTLKQEGSSTLCDTYHRTPSVSYKHCIWQ